MVVDGQVICRVNGLFVCSDVTTSPLANIEMCSLASNSAPLGLSVVLPAVATTSDEALDNLVELWR